MVLKTTKIGNDSNNRIQVTVDLSKLRAIEKELNTKFMAQVGVLGSKAEGRLSTVTNKKGKHKTGKSPSSQTNAEIGLIHEKGSKSRNIPRRSFLEVPLETKLPEQMNKIGKGILAGITSLNIITAFRKLGLIGEGIVLNAFNTSGYGQWAPNSPATIARKGSSMPLIDTAQLRKSISSRVVTK